VSKVKQHALYLSASRGLTVGSARFFFNLDPLFFFVFVQTIAQTLLLFFIY
jgi:hypothetical protein